MKLAVEILRKWSLHEKGGVKIFMDYQKAIMKRLQETREDQDISQTVLAEKVGMMDSAKICRLEKGNQELTMNDYIEICRALKVEPAYFLDLDSVIGSESYITHRVEKIFEIRSTSDDSRYWSNGIYSQEDLTFSMAGDHILLTVKDYLFTFMKELAKANKLKRKMPEIYVKAVESAFLEFCEQRKKEEQKRTKRSKKENFFFVSSQQYAEIVEETTEKAKEKIKKRARKKETYLLADKKWLESIIKEEVKLRIKTEFALEELED